MFDMLLNVTKKAQHGGARAGAGRKSVFASKELEKPFAMAFSPAGLRELRRVVSRTGLSRNGVIGVLALQHADALTFADRAPFPQKAAAPFSIRVPRDAGAKLAAARVRTGHSYSDIGEALVRWFARHTAFPKRPTIAQKP